LLDHEGRRRHGELRQRHFVRLAGPASRAGVFEEFRLGVLASQLATVEGSWSLGGSMDRTEMQLRAVGLGGDGRWAGRSRVAGAIVAWVPPTGRITGAATAFSDTGGSTRRSSPTTAACPPTRSGP
jgi:hypothetical protein